MGLSLGGQYKTLQKDHRLASELHVLGPGFVLTAVTWSGYLIVAETKTYATSFLSPSSLKDS